MTDFTPLREDFPAMLERAGRLRAKRRHRLAAAAVPALAATTFALLPPTGESRLGTVHEPPAAAPVADGAASPLPSLPGGLPTVLPTSSATSSPTPSVSPSEEPSESPSESPPSSPKPTPSATVSPTTSPSPLPVAPASYAYVEDAAPESCDEGPGAGLGWCAVYRGPAQIHLSEETSLVFDICRDAGAADSTLHVDSGQASYGLDQDHLTKVRLFDGTPDPNPGDRNGGHPWSWKGVTPPGTATIDVAAGDCARWGVPFQGVMEKTTMGPGNYDLSPYWAFVEISGARSYPVTLVP